MKKKLIEVALPLEAINKASAHEKSIRHGHPSTLHLWWARRPLATCRAVLFASLVDDPSARPEEFPTDAAQDHERLRLFGIIERLVLWENSNNLNVLEEARAEILKHTYGSPPPILDPFSGGGSIPLEAQRLGLEAHASDLNPVAVLISKALIEIPPKFAGQPPMNPVSRRHLGQGGSWQGAAGLAEDVRYYGKWMRDEADKRIGHLYPKATVWTHRASGAFYTEDEYTNILANTNTLLETKTSLLPHAADLERQALTVVAWLWARTVKCPNPVCGVQMPLVRTFAVSTKKGNVTWVEPSLDGSSGRVKFTIKTGSGKPREGTVGRRGAVCVCCGTPVPLDYVRAEGKAKRYGSQLMAVVAEGKRGRVYLPPSEAQENAAAAAQPDWAPETEMPLNPRWFSPPMYGMTRHADLFTPRQLVSLNTFSVLVGEARLKAVKDAEAAGLDAELVQSYGDAVATYLGFALSKMADRGSAICTWFTDRDSTRPTFARQAIAMTWDYAELNTLLTGTGSFEGAVEWTAESFETTPYAPDQWAVATQMSADVSASQHRNYVFSTDPPYYDNIGYADLSDFFYVWLRKSVGSIYPDLFGTMLVPKAEELVATPYRFGGSKDKARQFFEKGLHRVFCHMGESAHPDFPVTIYYAFKQSETDTAEQDGDVLSTTAVASTGWETFLQSLMDAKMQVTATWPMRTELGNRMIGMGTNALASSIVLACRCRPDDAPSASRREFVNALRRELAEALKAMMHGNVAPVDLAQATIGPGMAVYSRYAKVLEPDGTPLRVRTALQIINAELDAVLAEQEGEYDSDSRFCLAWFEQYSMNPGVFGEADVLARAKGTSVAGLAEGGVLEARSGKVRLLKRTELPTNWKPKEDSRRSVWEACQHLIRVLYDEASEQKAAELLAELGGDGEAARDLAYRLYNICERKGWAQEAMAYNSLVIAWSEVTKLSVNLPTGEPQGALEL
jgi:putative DNA methylase